MMNMMNMGMGGMAGVGGVAGGFGAASSGSSFGGGAPHHGGYNAANRPTKQKDPPSLIKTDDGQDPKSVLNQFLQRYCARPVSKGEITFTTTKYGRQHQSICKLACMNGQEVVGELQNNARDAEKSAALMTLQVYKPQIDALPPPGSKEEKKRKAQGQALTGEEYRAKKAKKQADEEAGIVNMSVSAKAQLNQAAMKIAKRVMAKGELVYECRQCTGGFQATVKISCLPEQWAEQLWAGEVKTTKQAAEQSAAEICLLTLQTEPLLKEKMDEPKGKGKSKGKGKGKSLADAQQVGFIGNKGKGKGKGKPPSGSEGAAEGEAAGEAAEGDDKGGLEGGNKSKVGKQKKNWQNEQWEEGWNQYGSEEEAMMGMMWMMMGGGDDWYGNGGNKKNKNKKGNDKADSERKRITQEATLGEILEWKGNMGWIKPAVEIEHEDSKKGGRWKGDRIYVHKKDVAKDCELAQGAVVRFHVYKDKSGLGACEVTL